MVMASHRNQLITVQLIWPFNQFGRSTNLIVVLVPGDEIRDAFLDRRLRFVTDTLDQRGYVGIGIRHVTQL